MKSSRLPKEPCRGVATASSVAGPVAGEIYRFGGKKSLTHRGILAGHCRTAALLILSQSHKWYFCELTTPIKQPFRLVVILFI